MTWIPGVFMLGSNVTINKTPVQAEVILLIAGIQNYSSGSMVVEFGFAGVLVKGGEADGGAEESPSISVLLPTACLFS